MTSDRLPITGKLSYLYERSPTHKHRGVDLAAKEGTPVHAAAAGVVRHAYSAWHQGFTGYGRVIVVQSDDGAYQLYAHLLKVDVSIGERVSAGEVIGQVGRTTFNRDDHESETVGPHLHFEVAARPYPMQPEAERVDPVAWLRAGRHVHPLAGYRVGDAPSSSSTPEESRPAERPLASSPSRCSFPCPHCGRGLIVEAHAAGGSSV